MTINANDSHFMFVLNANKEMVGILKGMYDFSPYGVIEGDLPSSVSVKGLVDGKVYVVTHSEYQFKEGDTVAYHDGCIIADGGWITLSDLADAEDCSEMAEANMTVGEWLYEYDKALFKMDDTRRYVTFRGKSFIISLSQVKEWFSK